MKVEYLFRQAVQPEVGGWAAHRNVPVYYFYTGEKVGPGRYVCTFCGGDTVVDRARVLSPCHSCDSSEFTLDAVAA